ncbi:7451_t:CDS:2 [Acaulospora morrowiae]|uniref:7451_t:CDS:1 n=1 Tax=Acaulospora morrowiae TaxID=94023 RepID=A0A9N8W4H9_9GLOM|nr:7451_t:CDS:2 [Acaulospora morrowiae]
MVMQNTIAVKDFWQSVEELNRRNEINNSKVKYIDNLEKSTYEVLDDTRSYVIEDVKAETGKRKSAGSEIPTRYDRNKSSEGQSIVFESGHDEQKQTKRVRFHKEKSKKTSGKRGNALPDGTRLEKATPLNLAPSDDKCKDNDPSLMLTPPDSVENRKTFGYINSYDLGDEVDNFFKSPTEKKSPSPSEDETDDEEGEVAEKHERDEFPWCPNCDAEINILDITFCPYCGKNILSDDDSDGENITDDIEEDTDTPPKWSKSRSSRVHMATVEEQSDPIFSDDDTSKPEDNDYNSDNSSAVNCAKQRGYPDKSSESKVSSKSELCKVKQDNNFSSAHNASSDKDSHAS